jgi:hypothetical protein
LPYNSLPARRPAAASTETTVPVKHLAYLNKYLLKYKYHLILGILFTTISNVFAIVPAQVVRYAFDLVKETIDLYFLHGGLPRRKPSAKRSPAASWCTAW